MTRYIVIGAGAVGASLAAQFETTGFDYALVGRGAQIRHIRENGLDYRRPSGTQHLKLKAFTADEPPILSKSDVLLLAVKSQDVEEATRFWSRRPVDGATAGSSLPLVAFQNGLAAEPLALRRFARVYGASIMTPARFTETGQVVAAGQPEVGAVVLGAYPGGEDETARTIVADLAKAGYLAETRSDIKRWKASKLAYNVKNVLELFGGTAEEQADFGDALEKEARVVLGAAGYSFAQPVERRVSIAHWGVAKDSGIEPGQQSTWQSFVRGSSSEVDFLNGEIVHLGRLHGIATPYNAAVQEAAVRLANAGSKPGTVPLADIRLLVEALASAA